MLVFEMRLIVAFSRSVFLKILISLFFSLMCCMSGMTRCWSKNCPTTVVLTYGAAGRRTRGGVRYEGGADGGAEAGEAVEKGGGGSSG